MPEDMAPARSAGSVSLSLRADADQDLDGMLSDLLAEQPPRPPSDDKTPPMGGVVRRLCLGTGQA